MLQFDMAGRIVEPGRLKKSMGGDFDSRGIPSLFEIPTTGDYSDVTVSDYSDNMYAKKLERPAATPGLAVARGPEVDMGSEGVGYHVSSRVIGGGSSFQASYGATSRDFFVGLLSDDGQNGVIMEYRSPDSADSGTFITGITNGTSTRKPINYQCNNPSERYAIELWVTKNTATSGWTATLCEGDRPRHVVDFVAGTVGLTDVRPVVGWDWTYDSGGGTDYFSVGVAQLSLDLYWRF